MMITQSNTYYPEMTMSTKILSRPGLQVDEIHDDRHELSNDEFQRESLAYSLSLPEHGIALFLYTWVNSEGVASGATAIWGPAIGPEPIERRLADRIVPRDMKFDEWIVDGLEIRQDLKFQSATVRWHDSSFEIGWSFEAFHPPYAYANHPDGCPSYIADNRVEQSGRVNGFIKLGEKVILFDTVAHRDHSWGTRDWSVLQSCRWLHAEVGDEVAVHFWDFFAYGQRAVRGYVFKDNLLAEIASLELDWAGDTAFNHISYTCEIVDDRGRNTKLVGDVIGHYELIPSADLVLKEGPGSVTVDGRSGSGWLEMGWPTAYLDLIIGRSAAQ